MWEIRQRAREREGSGRIWNSWNSSEGSAEWSHFVGGVVEWSHFIVLVVPQSLMVTGDSPWLMVWRHIWRWPDLLLGTVYILRLHCSKCVPASCTHCSGLPVFMVQTHDPNKCQIVEQFVSTHSSVFHLNGGHSRQWVSHATDLIVPHSFRLSLNHRVVCTDSLW